MDQSKFHFSDYRSGELVNGIDRSAHRALLYSAGLEEEDFHKPIIGVVNSFTEMVPGHINLRELAKYAALVTSADRGAILRIPEELK